MFVEVHGAEESDYALPERWRIYTSGNVSYSNKSVFLKRCRFSHQLFLKSKEEINRVPMIVCFGSRGRRRVRLPEGSQIYTSGNASYSNKPIFLNLCRFSHQLFLKSKREVNRILVSVSLGLWYRRKVRLPEGS